MDASAFQDVVMMPHGDQYCAWERVKAGFEDEDLEFWRMTSFHTRREADEFAERLISKADIAPTNDDVTSTTARLAGLAA